MKGASCIRDDECRDRMYEGFSPREGSGMYLNVYEIMYEILVTDPVRGAGCIGKSVQPG